MSRGNKFTPVEDGRGRVLAVEDHPPSLALLQALVRATYCLEIVGEADCGEQAVDLAWELKPDMVLMGVRMGGLGGIEAARRIKVSLPWTLVILVSNTRPDKIALDVEQTVSDAVIWKAELHPNWLDEIWRRSRQSE